MNNYFFRPNFYATRYNCSLYTTEEWFLFGRKDIPLGVLFIFIGLATQMVYIPFLLGMLRKPFRAMSCYKIMFFLGIVDAGNIFVAAFATGYLTIVGAVFCTHPTLIYFGGLLGVCSWCASCMTCCLLGLNRCIDAARPDLSHRLFHGWKTFVWLLLPAIYFLGIGFFEIPLLFNSNFNTWFYDPFIGIPTGSNYYYKNTTHAINNVAVIFVLCTESIVLFRQMFGHVELTSVGRCKRKFLLQTLIICSLVVVAAAVYVYMNYFYVPQWVTIIGGLAYAANSGSPAFIYLFLNDTLTKASFRPFSNSFRVLPNIPQSKSGNEICRSNATNYK